MAEMSSPRPGPARPEPRTTGLIRLGSVAGVPIFVTRSWFLVAGFITISYAGFMHSQVAGLSQGAAYALSLVFAVALAASVLLHELGHTLVSRAVGLRVGRIVVFLLGGISEIEGEPRRPRDEFAVAAAGPAVSFVLAGALWAVSLPTHDRSTASVMLGLLAWSNLVIALFNSLPGLPLDGGRVVQSLVWMCGARRETGAVVAGWSGRVVAVLVAAAVFALATMRSAVSFTSLGAAAMGFAVAGFLWVGASQTLRATAVERRALTLRAAELLRPTLFLPGRTPVAEGVRLAGEHRAGALVAVDAHGRSRGLVRESEVLRLPEAQRPWSTLDDLARPLEPGLILSHQLSGADLLEAIRDTPATEYLVVDDDGIARGVLVAADLARALGSDRKAPPR